MEEIKKVHINEVTMNDDNYEDDGYFDIRLNGEPFTGVVYDDENGYYEFNVVNGTGEGPGYSLYPNGKKESEFILKNGVQEKLTEWHTNGQKRLELNSDSFKKWSSEGVLLMERIDCVTKYFYKTGELKETVNSDPFGASYYVFNNASYYSKSGELLYQSFSKKPQNINAVKQYCTWYAFNDEAVETLFLETCDELDLMYDMSMWVHTLLDTYYEKGVLYLTKMLDHENLRVKYEGILLAENRKIKQVLPLLKELTKVKLTPPMAIEEGRGWDETVGALAKKVIRSIKNPFKRIRDDRKVY